jgi:hypothetical protein
MIKTVKRKRISKEIVRVWLDTVLNPIYNGLQEVLQYLKDNDYTWNWGYRDFIEIKTLGEFYDYRLQPNYDQLIMTEFPELLDLNIEYDQKRKKFNDSCCKLYDVLVESNDLKKIIDILITDYQIQGKIELSDADYLRNSDSMKWVAGYIINNRIELPYNNVFKNIWDNENVKIYDILNTDGIKEFKFVLDNHRISFKNIAIQTYQRIKEKSNEISLNYGVPIVIQRYMMSNEKYN